MNNILNITTPQFGMGLDIPWGSKRGFNDESGGNVGNSLRNFLELNSCEIGHFFFAFQPKNRNDLYANDYFVAYEKLFSMIPSEIERGFHHTLLNMGYDSHYPRNEIVKFTNEIVNRYNIDWVNEDLGIWSLKGKSLPYPLPPIMNKNGIKTCQKNIEFYKNALDCMLTVEFPGFTYGGSLAFGDLHAFDFFNEVVERSDCWVTLDTGHLLGYWFEKYNSFEGIDEALDRLPLDNCLEVHLSGAQISRGRFIDSHNGILLSEQLDLTRVLLRKCKNLRLVTYEDPVWDSNGQIIDKAKPRLEELKELVSYEKSNQ